MAQILPIRFQEHIQVYVWLCIIFARNTRMFPSDVYIHVKNKDQSNRLGSQVRVAVLNTM